MRDDPNVPLSESQLSAFLDGELPDEELDLFIRRLERDGTLKRSLSRYALIGEVMRTPANGGGVVAGGGFASRVSAAIDADSGKSADAKPGADAKGGSRWFGPLAGLSIAAGVAVVAVGLMNRAPDAQQPVAAVADRAIVAGDPSQSEASYVVPEITVTGPLVPAARLTNYVMAHSEYSSPIGRRNVLSNMLSDDSMSADGVIPAGFVPDEGPARQVSP